MKQVIEYGDLADHLASGKDFVVELGEQHGIGSSSLLVHKCGKTILIDRGIAFDGVGIDKVTTFPIGGNLEGVHLDVIIFTHVHADHAGLIVPTVLAHPEARVFLSEKTLEELRVVLADSLSVQRKSSKMAYHAGQPAPIPLFSEQDVATFLALAEDGSLQIVNTDEEDEWITFEDWSEWEFGFTFSGHTKGALISLVKCPDGDGLVFSGDVSGHNQETTRGVKILNESFLEMAKFRECRRIIMVTEATNGDRNQTESLEDMDARLKALLEETKSRGGNVLCPVFMVNRGPNIVVKFIRLGFNVFVAGGVRKTLAVEVGAERLEKWKADGTVMFIENGPNYMAMLRAAARGEYGFRPIVTSSATLDQGAGVEFGIHMLPVSENVLISTGHRFDGSAMKEFFEIKNRPIGPGYTIVLNQMDNHRLVATPVNVRCRGEHFDYSAHSYQSELVTLVAGLKPDVILIKHCTERGFGGLKSALRTEVGDKVPIERAEHLHLIEL